MTFSDFTKAMVVRVADRDVATIPYDKIEKLSYEYSEKHRITQGAIVMVASLGVGAMVMLTNSEGHCFISTITRTAARALGSSVAKCVTRVSPASAPVRARLAEEAQAEAGAVTPTPISGPQPGITQSW